MGSPRLLLVDDEPHLGLILGRVARRAGVEFASRTDARSAHELLQTARPDLTLLDVNLPGTSGVELLARLRAAPETATLRVALFCQSGLSGDIAAGWQAGADYLVLKDLLAQPEALQARLTEILAHADGRPPAPLLTWPSNVSGQTAHDWASAVERVLATSQARNLGGEVLEPVLRRALTAGFGTAAWAVSGVARIDRRALPGTVARQSLWHCFASLADQLWSLLGTDASGALIQHLQADLDRLCA